MNYNTEQNPEQLTDLIRRYPLATRESKDVTAIPYYPSWGKALGSMSAAILLKQIAFHYVNKEFQPFYKFRKPCQHEKYCPGDSWVEEIGIGEKAFTNALKKIGTRVKAGDDKKALLASRDFSCLVLYWVGKEGHITWYQLNMDLFEDFLFAVLDSNTSWGDRICDRRKGDRAIDERAIGSSYTENYNKDHIGEVENFKFSDQIGNLPDSENSPDQDQIPSLTASSLKSGFVSRNENNSQQAGSNLSQIPANQRERSMEPMLSRKLPINNRGISERVAAVMGQHGLTLHDWPAIVKDVYQTIQGWPNYQNENRTPEFKVIDYLMGIKQFDAAKAAKVQNNLKASCEAVRAKKHPIETTNTSPANLTSEQKIAIKQINLALQQGDRSLAQQIASEHGLN